MSQLRERIALLIQTAETQGWQTIVAPIDFMRAAFLGAPAGMEARLRQRALKIGSPQGSTLSSSLDRALLDEAADMIGALTLPVPEKVVDTADRIPLMNLIDVVDHSLLYIPAGPVKDSAEATRKNLWDALSGSGATPEGVSKVPRLPRQPEPGIAEEPMDAPESKTLDAEAFEAEAPTTMQSVIATLRETLATWQSHDHKPGDDDFRAVAEVVDQLYAYDLERLRRERSDSKEFESSMVNEWLEAHEKAIEAERKALKARQREREAVERCARIAEEPVELPPDARAMRLPVHAVQRHIAASIRRRGMAG